MKIDKRTLTSNGVSRRKPSNSSAWGDQSYDYRKVPENKKKRKRARWLRTLRRQLLLSKEGQLCEGEVKVMESSEGSIFHLGAILEKTREHGPNYGELRRTGKYFKVRLHNNVWQPEESGSVSEANADTEVNGPSAGDPEIDL